MLKICSVLISLCVLIYLVPSESTVIRGKNVPRIGRSNEADGHFDHTMGYVIKTMPNKNIPRMGRRNYNSEGRFDIPKYYQLPMDNAAQYDDEGQGFSQEQIENYFENLENTKK